MDIVSEVTEWGLCLHDVVSVERLGRVRQGCRWDTWAVRAPSLGTCLTKTANQSHPFGMSKVLRNMSKS